jgi:hypothetical protein
MHDYTTPAGCTHLLATEVPLSSRRIEWEKLTSRKVNVSALAGEFQSPSLRQSQYFVMRFTRKQTRLQESSSIATSVGPSLLITLRS